MAALANRESLRAEAQVLLSGAVLGGAKFDFELRARTFAKVLDLYRELGDKQGARVLSRLSNKARNIANFSVALDYLHEVEKPRI